MSDLFVCWMDFKMMGSYKPFIPLSMLFSPSGCLHHCLPMTSKHRLQRAEKFPSWTIAIPIHPIMRLLESHVSVRQWINLHHRILIDIISGIHKDKINSRLQGTATEDVFDTKWEAHTRGSKRPVPLLSLY
jgi:hypothetical protein